MSVKTLLLALLFMLPSCAPQNAVTPDAPVAVSETAPTLVAMSYNIAHGQGVDGINLARIADVITAAAPDVVALQEVDRNTRRSGNVDQAAVLASLTGMTAVFGRAIDFDGGQYGNAVLLRHPHAVVGNYPLPGVEDRAVLLVDVYWQGTVLTFGATHLDNTSQEDRIAAVTSIERILRAREPKHTLLGADVNDIVGSPTVDALAPHWVLPTAGSPTFPSWAPTREIDYVLHRGGAWSVLDYRVLNYPEASDHLSVVAALTLDPAAVPTPWPPSTVALAATSTATKNQLRVRLAWSGATTPNVDVYRNGRRVTTTANDGLYEETLRPRDGSSFAYQLCEAASYICSPTRTVGF